MVINKEQSIKFKIVSSLSMIGVVFIHSKFIMSRWGETMQTDSFWSVLSSALQYVVSEQIARVCVPIFFLMSGFFFFLKFSGSFTNFVSLLKKRGSSILIPYVFWAFFWFLINHFFNYSATEPFYAKIYNALVHPIPYQFWFLQILMICFVVSPLIHFLIKKTGSIFIIIIIIIYFLDFMKFKANIHGLIFYSVGAYLSQLKYLKGELFSKKVNFIVYFVLIVLTEVFFLASTNKFTIIWILIHKLSIVFGLIIVTNYLFFHKLIFNKSINFLRKINTGFFFFLFVTHEPILSFLKKIWIILVGNKYNLIAYFLLPVFIIIGTYVLYSFMERRAQSLLKFVTGGR